jgi:methionyl-tRNA formyltransferase
VSGTVAPVRVVFAGTPDVALPGLAALLSDPRVEVVGVLSNPARPRGRTGTPVDPPVAARGRELGLPVLQPERPADALDALRALEADVGAVVAYGAILPRSVLDVPRAGWVNLHLSLLPRWRGAAPVQHAVRAGDAVTGATVFRLDEGMDTGPVLRRVEVPVAPDVDAGDLLAHLAEVGAPVLVDGAVAAAAGEPGTPQPAEGATTAPRLGPADAAVGWAGEAAAVSRSIRAVTPRPGAVTRLRGAGLKLAGATVADAAAPTGAVPGTVLATDGDAVVVACGTGAVRIARLQPEGRRWAAAADVVRGRGLAVGDVLGADAS